MRSVNKRREELSKVVADQIGNPLVVVVSTLTLGQMADAVVYFGAETDGARPSASISNQKSREV